MTTNQIAYHRLQEDIRHDIATEIENYRSHTAGEAISWFDAFERKRANQADEGIRLAGLAETKRNNIATLAETADYHQEQAAISWGNLDLGWANLQETKDYHDASLDLQSQELELKRDQFNLDEERVSIEWQNADSNTLKAKASEMEALTHQGQLGIAYNQLRLDEQRVRNEGIRLTMAGEDLRLRQEQLQLDKNADERAERMLKENIQSADTNQVESYVSGISGALSAVKLALMLIPK